MSKFQNRCISFNGVLYVNFHWFVQVEWMHICIYAYMIYQLIYMYILIYIIYVHNNICILGRHIVVVNGVYTALKALSQSNRHAINWTQNKNISQDPKYKGFIGKHNRENIILKLIKVSLEAKAREYFIFYWLLSSHGNSLFVKGHTLICNVSLQEWLCYPCSCIFVFSLVFVFVSPLLQADGILGASLWPNCRHPGIFSHFSSFPAMNFFLEKLAFSPILCSCQLVWWY